MYGSFPEKTIPTRSSALPQSPSLLSCQSLSVLAHCSASQIGFPVNPFSSGMGISPKMQIMQ